MIFKKSIFDLSDIVLDESDLQELFEVFDRSKAQKRNEKFDDMESLVSEINAD